MNWLVAHRSFHVTFRVNETCIHTLMTIDPIHRRRCSFTLLMAVLCGLAGFAHSENIDWGSTAGGINQDSAGEAMDSGFTFQLGVFSSGFVPTAANLADWNAFWNDADEATYMVSENRFVSLHTVTDNNPPFLAGTAAWIMGTKETPTGTEKILFRRPSWTWPTPNPLVGEGTLWRVNGDANINVVIGTVNPGGSPFLMRSAIVRDYDQWRELKLADEPLNGPGDDPDGDGIPNAMEFVFDTDPLAANAAPATVLSTVEIAGEDYLQLTIPRNRSHIALLKVQVSSDLVTWNDGPAFTEVVTDGPLEWVVRDKTPVSSHPGGKRFMRLKIDLPE